MQGLQEVQGFPRHPVTVLVNAPASRSQINAIQTVQNGSRHAGEKHLRSSAARVYGNLEERVRFPDEAGMLRAP